MGKRDDLRIWLQFLHVFNGMSFWRDELHLGAEVHSDAARPSGYGIYFRG